MNTTTLASLPRQPEGRLARSVVVAIVLVVAAVLGQWAVPKLAAGPEADAKLEAIIPAAFGDWRIDASIIPLAPSPDQAALIGEIYDQTLSRTYVNARGERVMLSLAYGRNQSRRFQIHKPEVCYVGQGFKLTHSSLGAIPVGSRQVPVMELIAVQGQRVEPITYWIRVGDELGRGWMEQNRIRARYALHGAIPDGLLFRVSTISRGRPELDFDLHKRFINELTASMAPAHVAAVLGDVARLKPAGAGG
jgi:EpsI family protein